MNGVELDDGDLLFADAVIMGTGAVPNTSQLTGVQRAVGAPVGPTVVAYRMMSQADGSLPTDPFLGVQLADGSFSNTLYAAGDVARYPDVRTGKISSLV